MVGATKQKFVFDTSAIVALLLEEKISDPDIKNGIDSFYSDSAIACAPRLIITEIGNALKSAYLSKRISSTSAESLFLHFLNLHIEYKDPNPNKILHNSIEKNISFYDSTYLTLSQETGFPLLTLDKKLAKLAHA